jgi:hypothetical protein
VAEAVAEVAVEEEAPEVVVEAEAEAVAVAEAVAEEAVVVLVAEQVAAAVAVLEQVVLVVVVEEEEEEAAPAVQVPPCSQSPLPKTSPRCGRTYSTLGPRPEHDGRRHASRGGTRRRCRRPSDTSCLLRYRRANGSGTESDGSSSVRERP